MTIQCSAGMNVICFGHSSLKWRTILSSVQFTFECMQSLSMNFSTEFVLIFECRIHFHSFLCHANRAIENVDFYSSQFSIKIHNNMKWIIDDSNGNSNVQQKKQLLFKNENWKFSIVECVQLCCFYQLELIREIKSLL